MNFITGEKIQFLCDLFIGEEYMYDYNPNTKIYKERFLYINKKYDKINNKRKIFCYSQLLNDKFFDKLIELLKNMVNPFILVFHNSDYSFENTHTILFEKLDLLENIYTQNMNVVHSNVLPLPIGLANKQWTHGNEYIYKEVYEMNICKSNNIYFNFNINTNKEKRQLCYDIFKNKLQWNSTKDYKNYLIELKSCKFAICPEGNGLDTHRLWECLYMNTIPICLYNKFVHFYSQYFPIIIVNNWNDLNIEKLLQMDNVIINKEYLHINHIITNMNVPDKLFDIVIPVGPNDVKVIDKQIEYTKKNVIGYRNIFLVTHDPNLNVNGCITIDESIYPFNKSLVEQIHGKSDRNGWYLQQLLKLYAGLVIPNIMEKYLVIDSDTFFLKPTTFIENGKCLYNHGHEEHNYYFQHMKRLHPDLYRVHPDKSGICHHMMFETKYIKELFKLIEDKHNDNFYNVFLKQVHTNESDSGASEYEIYFNYINKFKQNDIIIRHLKWCNSRGIQENSPYQYVSCHYYMR